MSSATSPVIQKSVASVISDENEMELLVKREYVPYLHLVSEVADNKHQEMLRSIIVSHLEKRLIAEHRIETLLRDVSRLEAEKSALVTAHIAEKSALVTAHIAEIGTLKKQHEEEKALIKEKNQTEMDRVLESYKDIDSPLYFRSLMEYIELQFLPSEDDQEKTRICKWSEILGFRISAVQNLAKIIRKYNLDESEFPSLMQKIYKHCSSRIHRHYELNPNSIDGNPRVYLSSVFQLEPVKIRKAINIITEFSNAQSILAPPIAPAVHRSRKPHSSGSHSNALSSTETEYSGRSSSGSKSRVSSNSRSRDSSDSKSNAESIISKPDNRDQKRNEEGAILSTKSKPDNSDEKGNEEGAILSTKSVSSNASQESKTKKNKSKSRKKSKSKKKSNKKSAEKFSSDSDSQPAPKKRRRSSPKKSKSSANLR